MPARRRRSGEGGRPGPLPSKAEIAAFVAQSPRPVGRREIARAFNVKGADRTGLRDLLREMAAGGQLSGDRRDIAEPSALPPVGLAEVVAADDDGRLHVAPVRGGATVDGPTMVLSGLKNAAVPASLGVGDRVLVRFVPRAGTRQGGEDGVEGDVFHEARLIRALPRRTAQTLAVLAPGPSGFLSARPVAGRSRDELLVAAGGEAKAGDLVSVELADERRHGGRLARITARHGPAAAPSAVSLIAIQEQGIPHVFPAEVLAEAGSCVPPELGAREDLRDLPFVTIDPADARDHDDAIHAAPDQNRRNRGGIVVRVAIADVAWFVRPGSALDREARLRGNSVYFPDRVVPMLPEALSAGLCSLTEGEDRAALVARMTFDRDGRMSAGTFTRALIRSRASLTYTEVQDAVDGRPGERAAPLLAPVIAPLYAAFEVLAGARARRAPLEIDSPERRIVFDDKGAPVAVVTRPVLASHKLVEEFMIQANVAAAQTLEHKRTPFLRRVHEAPAPEKVEALAAFLRTLDLRLPRGQVMTPAHFNRLLAEAEETVHARTVNDAVLRAQAQAHYAPADHGHFGLNLRRYAHFTSPIRRYADIVAHRALIAALALGAGGLDRETIAALEEIGVSISEAERRAMAAERDTVDRLIAHFLADRIGADFAGRVVGVVRSGLFVELDDTGANGFVAAAGLGIALGDYFVADEAVRALVGDRSRAGYRVGDRVEVRLSGVDPVRGEIDLQMLTRPRAIAGVKARRGRGRAGPRGPRRP
jgi:ribonuclease R